MAKLQGSRIEKLGRIQKHHMELAKTGTGLELPKDVRDTLEDDLPEFTKEIAMTRKGMMEDTKGNAIPPYSLSLHEALELNYGIKSVNEYISAFGLRAKGSSMKDLARRFGIDNLSKAVMEKLLIEHSEFSQPMNTADIDSAFRFIIPEIFTSAIRVGYEHAVLHQNWIGSTINMAQETLKMPLILRGDGMPSVVNEGADIPVGSIKFGKKEVNVLKIGTGFIITDELLMASSLDLLFIFLQEVGNDMSIGADSLAFNVLVNGEQADLSESAPVVGVLNTANGFTYKDLKKVFTRMNRLKQPADRIISGEDDGIDLTSIDKFEGFNGQTRLASIRSIIGVPERFDVDTYVLPANQILYVNMSRAMVKLQYRGMLTERRRNPKNQTEEMYISDWINFAIVKRDARVIQDKSVTIVASPFPSYMDVDTRINNSFASL